VGAALSVGQGKDREAPSPVRLATIENRRATLQPIVFNV
jgi:hypothetical protein